MKKLFFFAFFLILYSNFTFTHSAKLDAQEGGRRNGILTRIRAITKGSGSSLFKRWRKRRNPLKTRMQDLSQIKVKLNDKTCMNEDSSPSSSNNHEVSCNFLFDDFARSGFMINP
ncbi:hypothetical protein HanHA300_Chr03g0074511 [Helianthus annuus]|nr:hypothetical protein HanHA300_Chr03g0074511 [Helianthus annuus]KAJ0606441.1 hypothetical protein HanHA89_Chr03g0085131 [Helianthus annuus]KAJ0766532.1 hypothetical protein HanLR1_Chr03g0078651 [Helianthus annuus]KAJ0772430.1 hypothetical protein HanOQP8_Chr03g0087221 [Helianthus annuus]